MGLGLGVAGLRVSRRYQPGAHLLSLLNPLHRSRQLVRVWVRVWVRVRVRVRVRLRARARARARVRARVGVRVRVRIKGWVRVRVTWISSACTSSASDLMPCTKTVSAWLG